MLYVVFSLFLLGLLPHLFSIPHIGSGGDIVTMMIPFLLGTSFLALAVSRWFTDSEAPLLMIAFFSVGYIFLSGVSYPLELMPWYWQTAHYLFPAGPATCFCKTEFNGWNAGRRMAADADDVDTSIGLWNFGALHYTPPLRKRKSEGIKKAIYPRQPIFC